MCISTIVVGKGEVYTSPKASVIFKYFSINYLFQVVQIGKGIGDFSVDQKHYQTYVIGDIIVVQWWLQLLNDFVTQYLNDSKDSNNSNDSMIQWLGDLVLTCCNICFNLQIKTN